MENKRITDLPELIQADNGDFIPIVDSSMNVTKRVAAEKVLPNSSVDLGRIDGGDDAGVLLTDSSGNVSAAPVVYGGNSTLSSTTTKTLTPPVGGVLYVTAHSRRNAGSTADNVINISVSGSSGISGGAVGNGSVDGFAKADYVGTVSGGTSITITITASNTTNGAWKYFIIPGAPELV
ncbi:hypothetical protein [Dietzia natronolimnaea]|uniref:hypothetical protein n=1 Tax=Dietzia natronolimnaea TaxID=161920 RepID=UPI0015FD5EC7|nr:hypothetical protein [Dietzia natronolimnaea]MBB1037409.1 hypothetical protein [Dietzia natronolimnaea]